MSTTLDAQPDASSGQDDTGREAEALPSVRGPTRLVRRARMVLGSAWVPVALVVAFTAFVLRFYGVPLTTTAVFGAYVLLGIVVPGTLVWRVCHRRVGWFVGDVAGGVAVGYVMEILAYLGARALGVPLLVLALPAVIWALFLAVPALRVYWRGARIPGDRTPLWWAWSLSAIVAVIVFRSVTFFRWHLLQWPFTSAVDADSPFHLALIGEAKHHIPLMTPWVSSEPVLYHWFAYPEMAATSWVTGIEPLVLLFRLSPLPMVVAFLVLIAAMARRLTGVWWTGVAAIVATFLVLAPNPYSWPVADGGFGFSTVEDGSVLRVATWTSPTQTLGALLFAGIVLLLIGLLVDDSVDPGRWSLMALLLAGLAGAKAPYLPMLLAGLLLVVAVVLVAGRRWHRAALLAAGMTVAFVALSQLLVYRGTTQMLTLSPLAAMRWFGSGAAATTGFTALAAPVSRLLVAAALTVLCWIFMWAGIAGLVARRRIPDPPVVLLLGLGAVGMAGLLLLGHPGGAESYFLVSARPYLALAAVVGLAAALGRPTPTTRTALAVVASVCGGAVVVLLVRLAGSPAVPVRRSAAPYTGLAWELTWPFLLLIGAVALVAAGLYLARRRFAAVRGLALAVLVSLAAGFGVLTAADQIAAVVREPSTNGGWRRVADFYLAGLDPSGRAVIVTRDMAEAGRWLRDNSARGDLVATNAHCLARRDDAAPCDNRHFALAAIAERRILVEGWGYTHVSYRSAEATGIPPWYVDYWDRDRLAANDAAFSSPSADTVGLLRDRYGVRWLLVDTTQAPFRDAVGPNATLRYKYGTSAVYEVEG